MSTDHVSLCLKQGGHFGTPQYIAAAMLNACTLAPYPQPNLLEALLTTPDKVARAMRDTSARRWEHVYESVTKEHGKPGRKYRVELRHQNAVSEALRAVVEYSRRTPITVPDSAWIMPLVFGYVLAGDFALPGTVMHCEWDQVSGTWTPNPVMDPAHKKYYKALWPNEYAGPAAPPRM